MPRVTSPCNWLTALTPAAVRIARAVMLNCGPHAVVVGAQRHEALARYSPRLPQAPAMCVSTSVEGERVVAGRHRRVGREHRGGPDMGERRVETARPARCGPRYAAGRRTRRAPRSGATRSGSMPIALSALTPPRPRTISCCRRRFLVAPVQAGRQPAVPRRVLLEVGVQQEEPSPCRPAPCHTAAWHGPRRRAAPTTMHGDPSGRDGRPRWGCLPS